MYLQSKYELLLFFCVNVGVRTTGLIVPLNYSFQLLSCMVSFPVHTPAVLTTLNSYGDLTANLFLTEFFAVSMV
jgi:hypothetical protein